LLTEANARQAEDEASTGQGAGEEIGADQPTLVAEFKYRAWTNDGKLRHASQGIA
jgi:ATP-dependent DNA ligase